MAKVLGIISGKGGVGKTTTAINLGLALNNFGRRVVVVDGDLLKPNLAHCLGFSKQLEHTIHNALLKGKQLDEMVYVHTSGLKFIPGDTSQKWLKSDIKLKKSLLEEMKSSELVILDTPPGYSPEAVSAIKACDAVIVVVTPETAAVAEGLRCIRFATSLGTTVLGVVVNRYDEGRSYLTPEDIAKVTGKEVIAVIAEEENMSEALKEGHPIVYLMPESKATTGYKQLAAKLLGERYVDITEKMERESLFNRILKKLNLV
ncbi:hypothetical protein DRJ48_00310 [Candidatus Woesearchaeota archaeon]|nr:P-loop NTPase [Candidatus Woesearchaeota archaeon]RLE43692.1 MAG: hypothetical protein DRJ48_00310 [Candidatus Woesearchaeota archaeon]